MSTRTALTAELTDCPSPENPCMCECHRLSSGECWECRMGRHKSKGGAGIGIAQPYCNGKREDAAFIVRAMNAHDELVEALSAMLSLHGKPMRDEWINDQAFKFCQDVTTKASAALAKATGSQSGTAGNASAMKELPGSPKDGN